MTSLELLLLSLTGHFLIRVSQLSWVTYTFSKKNMCSMSLSKSSCYRYYGYYMVFIQYYYH